MVENMDHFLSGKIPAQTPSNTTGKVVMYQLMYDNDNLPQFGTRLEIVNNTCFSGNVQCLKS